MIRKGIKDILSPGTTHSLFTFIRNTLCSSLAAAAEHYKIRIMQWMKSENLDEIIICSSVKSVSDLVMLDVSLEMWR